MAAGTRVSSERPRTCGSSVPPCWATAARTLTVIRIGATERSCARRTAKVDRPTAPFSRPRSASTGMTTAVDDRARPMPSTAAPANDWPASMKAPDSTTVQAATCIMPRPNTSRRMARSRSHDSSSPIMNNRKATPSSDNWASWAGSRMVIQDSQGAASANRPRPSGPRTTPAARQPSTGLIFNRLTRGTMTPAAARKTTRSL